MKAILIALVIFTSAGFAYWDQVRVPVAVSSLASDKTETLSAQIPNAEVTLLSGELVKLHDYKGKVLLLHFWATWCAPCVKEFPQLLELAKRYEDDIILLAVSVDKSRDAIPLFLKKLQIENVAEGAHKSFVLAHDPMQKLSQDVFQTVKYPETFIIAPDLTVSRKVIGETNWGSPEIQSHIEVLTKTGR